MWSIRSLSVAMFLVLAASPLAAADEPPLVIRMAYLGQQDQPVLPHSYLDVPPTDQGVQGARLGVADNNTTGHFTRQTFELDEAIIGENDNATDALRRLLAAGHRFVIADLPAEKLLAAADLPEAKDVTFFNTRAEDDELRGESCRANVLHTIPSRAMLADALVQYLVLKRWRNILLAVGPTEGDRAYADAMKRAIKKFSARLVEEKPWTYNPGARRTDTGHYAIAAEVGRFTQGVSYDILVVADEDDEFGDDLSYRTTDPRPVAGTQGMTPAAWARPHEQWGATQLQNRFLRQAKRWMTDRDYAAWMAVRAIGEAATRTNSNDPAKIAAYLRGKDFELAAFKGTKLSFRDWDGQLRQPILLVDTRSLISVSPQEGFLHQFSVLDTLGIDRPETKCRLR